MSCWSWTKKTLSNSFMIKVGETDEGVKTMPYQSFSKSSLGNYSSTKAKENNASFVSIKEEKVHNESFLQGTGKLKNKTFKGGVPTLGYSRKIKELCQKLWNEMEKYLELTEKSVHYKDSLFEKLQGKREEITQMEIDLKNQQRETSIFERVNSDQQNTLEEYDDELWRIMNQIHKVDNELI